jgi:hypothetical protein
VDRHAFLVIFRKSDPALGGSDRASRNSGGSFEAVVALRSLRRGIGGPIA